MKLITNIGLLVTALGKKARRGSRAGEVREIPNAALLVQGEKIAKIGQKNLLEREFKEAERIDAQGRLMLPGFVDPHTHLVFVGSREREFVLRLQGKSYVEIAKEGGGILHTVRRVRKASKEELFKESFARLDRLLSFGVTTVEAKSGYALNTEGEVKLLEVIQELDKSHPIDVVPTFLGAHEVPPEYRGRKEEYVELLLEEMIPAVGEKGLAKFCDVFCEAHVFQVEESRKILLRAKEFGMLPKLHADEIEPLGGAELAAEVNAISADHLGAISEQGIRALAKSETIAVLLPGTSFFLRLKKHPPARKLIEQGIPLALATDLNPGSSMTENYPLILTLACLQLGLTPKEAFVAATLNAACAIGCGHDRGTLEVGKLADFTLWEAPNLEYIPYHYGVSQPVEVWKRGEKVWQKS